jgi:RecJ-like exonuclease
MTCKGYDYLCIDCDGSGQNRSYDICSVCEGYGYLMTDSGRLLIEFLQRRGIPVPMSPQAEDELRGMTE